METKNKRKIISILNEYNINYFSPSSLNDYLTDPAKWLVNRILLVRANDPAPAMWRGTAVEKTINIFLIQKNSPNKSDYFENCKRIFNINFLNYIISSLNITGEVDKVRLIQDNIFNDAEKNLELLDKLTKLASENLFLNKNTKEHEKLNNQLIDCKILLKILSMLI